MSALLFLAALVSLAFAPLQYFAHMPLIAVGLAMGLWPAAIAGVVASGIAFVLTPSLALVFAAFYGAPAVLLVRYALLNRVVEAPPEGEGGDEQRTGAQRVEWYPPGHLLGVLAGYALALLVLTELFFVGEGGVKGLTESLLVEATNRLQAGVSDQTPIDLKKYGYVLIGMLAGSWIIMIVVNGTLAQTFVRGLTRNLRPSPHYRMTELQDWPIFVMAILAVLLFVGGAYLGFLAAIGLVLLTTLFFLQGLALVHSLVPRTQSRTILLGGFYFLLAVTFWLVIPVAFMGLLEQRLRIRTRLTSHV